MLPPWGKWEPWKAYPWVVPVHWVGAQHVHVSSSQTGFPKWYGLCGASTGRASAAIHTLPTTPSKWAGILFWGPPVLKFFSPALSLQTPSLLQSVSIKNGVERNCKGKEETKGSGIVNVMYSHRDPQGTSMP